METCTLAKYTSIGAAMRRELAPGSMLVLRDVAGAALGAAAMRLSLELPSGPARSGRSALTCDPSAS